MLEDRALNCVDITIEHIEMNVFSSTLMPLRIIRKTMENQNFMRKSNFMPVLLNCQKC